jgi:hypothetical protein
MTRSRTPLVDVAAIKREIERDEANDAERLAERTLLGNELSVLGAMIKHYDYELFVELERDDFFYPQHVKLFDFLRALEHEGRHVDGEFLLSDIAARIDAHDREFEASARTYWTDEKLQALIAPPRWVVPCVDVTSIANAITWQKAISFCRHIYAHAVDVRDYASALVWRQRSRG